MKNHFFIAYAGNKRNEVVEIENTINLKGINTVVEPYCGSAAISYYIWLKHPNLKFILNDNNAYLKDLYDICKDEDKLKKFEDLFKTKITHIGTDKAKYTEVTREKSLIGWFISNKYYNIRPGLFPTDKKMNPIINLKSFPIFEFYKNANIEFYCSDGIEIYEKYNNDSKTLILMDPPYISTCNDFYAKTNMNIYEYLYHNNIELKKARIYLILEDIWIIKLLFARNKVFNQYSKRYECSKKNTFHVIISNESTKEPIKEKKQKVKKSKIKDIEL